MRNQTIFLGILLLASSFLSSCDTGNTAENKAAANAPNQNEMPQNQATDSLMKSRELPMSDSLQDNEASEKSEKDKD